MQISMWMLADRLQALHPQALIQVGKRILRNARLLADSQERSRATLYLQQNDPSTIMCLNGHDIIVFNSSDVDLLLNAILDVFDRLNEWSDQADELIRGGCQLEELLAYAANEAGMYLLVADATYLIHAYAPFGEPLGDEREQILVQHSMEIDVILDVDAKPMVRSADVGIYYVDTPQHNLHCPVGNIFLDGVHQGWLIGMRNDDEFTQGDLDMLDAVLDKVEVWMSLNREAESHRAQTGVFDRLLEGAEVDETEARRLFDVLAWRAEDNLRVYAVRQAHERGKARLVAERFLDQLSRNSFLVHAHDDIAIVANESLMDVVEYRAKMEDILRTCGYAAGASPLFQNIMTLRRHYDAACVAAEAAEAGSVIEFEDVKLTYALSLVESGAVADVRHRALSVLGAYDADHGTQLLPTLECFVRNRGSYVSTYEELFIHRSTLSYRLERIAAIADLDLDDEKTWNHLTLSFMMEN